MPRLIHIVHHDGAGGGPVVISHLLRGLKDTFDQEAWFGGEGRISQTCRDLKIPTVPLNFFPVWKSPIAFFQLFFRLRSSPPALVILHGQWAGPVGALAARLAGVASIYVAHCPAFYHSTSLAKAIRNYVAEKIPCHFCAKVVTLSEGNHYNYLFRGWAPEGNLVRIANGIDAAAVPDHDVVQALRAKWKFSPTGRHAIFVGRIDDQKRVDWLLEAWAAASSIKNSTSKIQHPPHFLWIVGDGSERAACEKLAHQLQIKRSVRFVGAQPDGLSWIAAADVVVMTSLYEGHALVPLEAMACSKPVVAFATDGITDSVVDGETGSLCELGETRKLGQRLASLLNDDQKRCQLGDNGRRRVIEKFSLATSVQAYRELVKTLIG